MSKQDDLTPEEAFEFAAGLFAHRVALAKRTEQEVIDAAVAEYRQTVAWVQSESRVVGSFNYYCDEFELEPSAVRRAIRERK